MNALTQTGEALDLASPTLSCKHCGLAFRGAPTSLGEFCCSGCAAAYHLIQSLGLDRYYEQRITDPAQPPRRPEEVETALDLSACTRSRSK